MEQFKPVGLHGPMLPPSIHALRSTYESKVRFRYLEYVSYPYGLYKLMNDFFKIIWIVEVEIIVLQFIYQDPQIHFEMYGEQGELKFWKAMDTLRKRANETCHRCGRSARKQCHEGAIVILCQECLGLETPVPSDTGTWLDRY